MTIQQKEWKCEKLRGFLMTMMPLCLNNQNTTLEEL
jgi:hypothetical protein